MSTLNIDDYGGHGVFTWTHEHLYEVLTTGKNPLVKNFYLKNALKLIKRENFVSPEMQSIAYSDKEIDLGYGEQLDKPTVIAQMLEFMQLKPGGKYLDVGTGTGYAAALLAAATGENGYVYSIERVQFIAQIARDYLKAYPDLKNLEVVFRDGSIGFPEKAPFDGIHIAAAFAEVPDTIKQQLNIGGRLVMPTLEEDVRVVERIAQDEYSESIFEGFYFKPVEIGIV